MPTPRIGVNSIAHPVRCTALSYRDVRGNGSGCAVGYFIVLVAVALFEGGESSHSPPRMQIRVRVLDRISGRAMVRDMNTETIDDGGPAFPRDSKWQLDGSILQRGAKGMSLRDWFAGREALSDYDHPDSWKHYSLVLEAVNGPSPDSVTDTLGYFKWECEGRAKMKLMRADAMLSARKGASK